MKYGISSDSNLALNRACVMDESQNSSNLRTLRTKFDTSDGSVVGNATDKKLEDLLNDCRSRIVEQAFLPEVRRDGERDDCWLTIL